MINFFLWNINFRFKFLNQLCSPNTEYLCLFWSITVCDLRHYCSMPTTNKMVQIIFACSDCLKKLTSDCYQIIFRFDVILKYFGCSILNADIVSVKCFPKALIFHPSGPDHCTILNYFALSFSFTPVVENETEVKWSCFTAYFNISRLPSSVISTCDVMNMF